MCTEFRSQIPQPPSVSRRSWLGIPIPNQKFCILFISPSKYLLGRIEGHGEACNKEVGEGKADQEVVVDASQLPVEEHTGDHQQVGEDRHQDDGD